MITDREHHLNQYSHRPKHKVSGHHRLTPWVCHFINCLLLARSLARSLCVLANSVIALNFEFWISNFECWMWHLGLDFMDNSAVRVESYSNLRVDYENALINAGFGKFHFYLLIVCGMIYMNTAIGITIISFVLPSATCDFRMSSSDKGLLTAAPMLGMCISLWFFTFIFNF